MSSDARQLDPFEPFLTEQGFVVLDGGLASELERQGCNLNDELWSAKCLIEETDLIGRIHSDYLQAGADCIVTASYQATEQGFMRRGLDGETARALLQKSVDLAIQSRQVFWSDAEPRSGRLRPIVAASIGPYGAFLADGSEYRGDYDLDVDGLFAFHRPRFERLVSSGADLLACETIPSFDEALALKRLVVGSGGFPAWFSFSCADGQHLADGTELERVLATIEDVREIVAVGVNCTAPRYVSDLLMVARRVSTKPLIVYPNSGENWQAKTKRWAIWSETDETSRLEWQGWYQLGARILGGCCRIGPDEIRRIRAQLTVLPAGKTSL